MKGGARADELRTHHDEGRSWMEIVTAERPPLIVERLTRTLDALSEKGANWRRTEALALRAEGVSINRIAALYGVTRQRTSALIRNEKRPDLHCYRARRPPA